MFRRKRGEMARRWPISAKLLILSSLVTILGFSAVCGTVLLDMRRAEEELARQTSENLATTIDADISRTIELYDRSLRAVIAGMQMPEVSTLSKPLRQLVLFDQAASASHFGAIQVFDAKGDLILDAANLDPLRENRADEQFFKVHRSDGEVGLFLSRPMLYRGAYSIVVSRRISDAEGSFAGVVVGAIRFTYFHELFDRLRLNPEDTISVVRRDGMVLMRTPFDLDLVGYGFRDRLLMRRLLIERSGAVWSAGSNDGVPRLYIWRNSGRHLVVVVGKATSNIYGTWQKQAIRIGAIMLGLICFVGAVSLFLAREINRRARAEGRLEELATTDALTGLRNRRKFDTEIETEWRRAIRQSGTLALLLIDADHFKQFNDTFGHQAGDHALKVIADCIQQSATRAGDCAARYGGEEFAVLLPGISATEALVVAERIRLRVSAVPAAPEALTVSIGVASMTPIVTMDHSDLVEAADKALYAAKDAGRNQSMIATPQHLMMAA
ncbi:sensor domain-containing diguanylate cyclase [Rhodopseudomonas sp. P2A-2r]|uniref:sensor domain-containing diguanylate cyclase n=1 Tax=unclassified Rhodopseudomonas TaxID=2638247 RepID=UPI00223442CA|nr:sensor domain-containing diguanylate cyclase [Rhodopseudomonas sp. P2A-2r]UZE50351.1 sensor domain-containing diguanylate cyclase [Rhodopseudomonas sp. P2A-2r]